ncbi:unnamed protein product [Bursaphelenchus okinawaensis]|uniref:Fungal lipase-type domain-containing protein n=1 Tax=Bursaphelenchus okinawaensis TaxID=465554 RepID=A0A811L135_9BILA|nr:unnamed protein product [Bursaphelenchus okinawaensis]CAG9114839.1 unnamed protein product [Bursaphelenchus okinawaensis]
MFPLAAAAYSDDPNECLNNNFEDAKTIGVVLAKCQNEFYTTLCVGFVAVSHTDKAIILSFRGTNNFLQLVTEVSNIAFFNRRPSPFKGQVAQYFFDVHEQLWEAGIHRLFEKAIKSNPDYEIWVTGHSLGGAVAAITATKIYKDYEESASKMKLVTFGQPRTGDNVFADTYPNAIKTAFRVTHKRDVVPHVPPKGYVGYNHHFSEVWYSDKMNQDSKFVYCKEEEGKKCSNSAFLPVSVIDHVTYYNEFVPVFGIKGCKWSSRK